MEHFIKSIKIRKVRHLENIEIPISEIQKKHLILTGKNGSGKTSILESIKTYLSVLKSDNYAKVLNSNKKIKENMISVLEKGIKKNESTSNIDTFVLNKEIAEHTNEINKNTMEILNYIENLDLILSDFGKIIEKYNNGEFILAYFDAKRKNSMKTPNGPTKSELNNYYNIETKANEDFLQYLVNLKTQKSFAMSEGKNIEIIEKIDKWFETFENGLQEIFGDKKLKLDFDFLNYNFNIISEGREPFNLNQLSDGYSAVINIITDIIMRMESNKNIGYDLEGIVLIDELETHLHIELQKKILPFLTKFFPKIQFIITTHSPFVLNSIENAVIYDLENKTIVEDLSAYSYDGIVENYFDIDKYSSIIKTKMERYESLLMKDNLSEDERRDKEELRIYLEIIPFELAPELSAKITELKMKYGVENV